MTVGPLGIAAGLALLSRVQADATYVGTVLPGLLVFGLGLALTVAPLTATVLAAAPARHAGIASGVNNAISRGAGLVAVAVIPGLTGLTGDAYRDPAVFASGFRTAMLISAALAAAGGVLAWSLIRNEVAGRADRARPPSSIAATTARWTARRWPPSATPRRRHAPPPDTTRCQVSCRGGNAECGRSSLRLRNLPATFRQGCLD